MTDLASICSSNKELVQGCSKKKKREKKKTPKHQHSNYTSIHLKSQPHHHGLPPLRAEKKELQLKQLQLPAMIRLW